MLGQKIMEHAPTLPNDEAPTLMSYVVSTVKSRPALLQNFNMTPAYLFSQEFIESTLASGKPGEVKEALVRKANNNLLISSLMLGISFSMIGGDYTPHGWEGDNALIYETVVETLAFGSCMLFVVGLLANTGLATTAGAVPPENFRLWGRANLTSIVCAELPIMGGIWLNAFAMAAACYAAIPHTPVFWCMLALLFPCTGIPATLNLNVVPLLTTQSGVLSHAAIVPAEQQLVLTKAEAEAVLIMRALAASGTASRPQPGDAGAQGAGAHSSIGAPEAPQVAAVIAANTALL